MRGWPFLECWWGGGKGVQEGARRRQRDTRGRGVQAASGGSTRSRRPCRQLAEPAWPPTPPRRDAGGGGRGVRRVTAAHLFCCFFSPFLGATARPAVAAAAARPTRLQADAARRCGYSPGGAAGDGTDAAG